MKLRTTLWRLLLIFGLLYTSLGVRPVDAASQINASAILQSMTAEEKIGQLFLVTFDGTDIDEESEIFNLISRYHIGGVVLLAENNNFLAEDTIPQTHQLISGLQQIEWDTSSGDMDVESGLGDENAAYVPLFIGLKQLGDGVPSDQLYTGLTQMPSQMAVGATWDTSLAERVGEVLGSELNTLGINLYLGPNLDVLETANSEAANSLGVNTYGGDPFWVGEMGKSFVTGLHNASNNRILVVAQNFPGTGNSDRSPESEVATVRKSLEQLKQIELAPYMSVTEPNGNFAAQVEAVMVSHIRYQGFQGNIRETTRPISFDSNALQQIMDLPAFANWRQNGGLIISDNLGSASIRRFFDPNETNFDARQIARNAFLAGNDILYLDGLKSTGDPDPYTTLISIHNFFVQKYREDAAFASRVDASVERILNAKIGMYETLTLQNVLKSENGIETLGQSQQVTFNVAQNAVTLISPDLQELDTILPSPPLWYEDIVIFTDVRQAYQCSGCPLTNNIKTNALATSLVKLYGPDVGGQIQEHKLSSYTFSQLVAELDNLENGGNETLEENLVYADWVIFNTLNIDPAYPESNALQRVLAERPDLLKDKNVIVFALGSPTYLDATNISKVTAYFALYSKTPAFLDVAARVLMKELDPTGALPVSLNAVGYDLITVTSPDPDQVISLDLVLPETELTEEIESTPEITQTPEPTAMPRFNIGDVITIQTGQIYDHNRHIVPDGTIVRFNFNISGEPGILQQFETTTTAGVANFTYRVEAAGGLEVSATSEPANQSEIIKINIAPDGSTSIQAFTPTPMEPLTPTPTPSPTITETPEPTPTVAPVVNHYPTLGNWAMGMIVTIVGAGLAFMIGYYWWGTPRWGLRSGLSALIGGLLAYSYLNLGIESTKYWIAESGAGFVVEVIIAGLLFGWIVSLVWWMRTAGRYPAKNNR